MARGKSEKMLYDLNFNIWQKTNHQINLKFFNPYNGKKEHISSIEHSDKHHGNQMKRTHNDLFKFFKEILESEGKWQHIETKLGTGKKKLKSEEMDLDNKYGFIYLTTNLINGKRYVGKHSKLGDNYIGSGTDFKKDVEKFGKENFEREIIAYAYSAEQLNVLEKAYIDSFDAINDDNFYNKAPGGDGWYEKKEEEKEEVYV